MFSVIFDMDGTLLDTQSICIPAWEYAGKLQGVDGMGAYMQYACGMNLAGGNRYLRENFPLLDVDRFRIDERVYIKENLVPAYKKGGKELMAFLEQHGVKMGLASGSTHKSIEHHFAIVGGYEKFSAVVGGADVENGKPAPDIFLLAAEKMGVDPKTCFVFEDSVNGIKAGVAAGMKSIGVEDVVAFDDATKSLLTAQFASLDEAIPFFEQYL